MFYRLIFSTLLLCVSAVAWGQATSTSGISTVDSITVIKHPDGASNNLGSATVLSGDGQTLIVSEVIGTGETSGSGLVRVYGRTVTGGWELRQTLEASNAGDGDLFGSSLAISDDSNTIVVGAPQEDSAATGVSSIASTDNDAENAGAVYVFTHNGTEWRETAYLKAGNADAEDFFSFSLAISSDGERIAVGATFEDSSQTTVSVEASTNNGTVNSGAVYVFKRNMDSWQQEAYFKAPNADGGDQFGNGDRFGNSVALNADGTVLAVGADFEDSINPDDPGNNFDPSGSASEPNIGAVYVFKHNAMGWSDDSAYLKSIDLTHPSIDAGSQPQFGDSVSLSGDGRVLAVGASGERLASGGAYVFRDTGEEWVLESGRLTELYPDRGDRFGNSVSLSHDGRFLAVGAHSEQSTVTSTYSLPEFISDNDGRRNSDIFVGIVYVYALNPFDLWEPIAVVKPSEDNANLFYGFSVAWSGTGDNRILAIGSGGFNSLVEVIPTSALPGTIYIHPPSPLFLNVGDTVDVSVEIVLADRYPITVSVTADDNLMVTPPSFELMNEESSAGFTITTAHDLSIATTMTQTVRFTADGDITGTLDVTIVPPIELEVMPSVLNLYRLSTTPIRVSVSAEHVVIAVDATDRVGLAAAEYRLGTNNMVDIPLTGIEEGQATITLTARGLGLVSETVEVSVEVLESLEVLSSPREIHLRAGEQQEIEVALNRIAPEIGDVTVSLGLSRSRSDARIRFMPSTLLFTQAEADTKTVTVIADADYIDYAVNVIHLDADNGNYIDTTVDIQPPIGLEVIPQMLTLYRLNTTQVAVSVVNAATVTVEATERIRLSVEETEYELAAGGMVDLMFTGIAAGAATITLTAQAEGLRDEVTEVSVEVLESLEVLSSPRQIHLRAGEERKIEVALNRIASEIGDVTVSLDLSRSDARIHFMPSTLLFTQAEADTKTVTVITDADYIDYAVNVIHLDADNGNYIDTTVDIQPPIGLEVIPQMLTLYRLNTTQVAVSVTNAATVTVGATAGIRLGETRYELAAGETVDLMFTGVAAGPATITLTAQTQLPVVRDEVIEVSVEVRESLEVLVNPPQIDLLTGEPVEIEVSLNRIAPEIGPVTVSLILTSGGEEISLSTSTLIFTERGTQMVTITGSGFTPYSEIVFDADNENYVDATVVGKGAFNRFTGDDDDDFGHSVAISAKGKTLVVGDHSGEDGAPNDSGLVYVYTKDTLGLWSLRQTLKASNAGRLDEFGCSLAIDNDGGTIAVGACGEDSSQTGVSTAASNNNGLSNSGAAYVFVNNGEEWIEEAYFKASNPSNGARFGHSIALNRNGTALLVGAPSARTVRDATGPITGAAYLFTESDSAWMYRDADSEVGAAAVDSQTGFSVAMSGSGSRAVLGSITRNQHLMNAGVITRYNVINGLFTDSRFGVAPNPGRNHEFGNALAINDGGGRLAVSEHQNSMEEANSGAVYIYGISNIIPIFQSFTKAPNIGENDLFGSSIAMSKDGQYVAVGARLEDGDNTGIYIGEDFDTAVGNNNSGNNVGAVYVYEIASDGAFTLLSVVKPSIASNRLNYGISVGLGGVDEERSLVIGGAGMVEVIPFSELLPIGLSVSTETLTVTRLEMSSVRVSVDRAATVSVGAEGMISLEGGETLHELSSDGAVDVFFTGAAIGAGTLTFTARAPTEREEIVQVFVTVTPSLLEIQADRPIIYSLPGSTETVEITITDIPEAVMLTIESANPDVATVTDTVITGLRDSIDLEISALSVGISTFTLTARHPDYADASTQIIVHVLPAIGLAATPPVLNIYRLSTRPVRVSVNTPAVITAAVTDRVSLEETEYTLGTAGTVDIPVTGVAEGQATITLTARDPLGRTKTVQVQVEVLESLEVLVNTSQIALVTGEEVQVEVALNRIANEIGPVTVTLTFTSDDGEISISTSTLLFANPLATQVITITGSGFAPYREIVFDADNENYVDATVGVRGAFSRLTGDANYNFGHRVAISADGQTVMVGEPSGEDEVRNSGLAHIYTKDALGIWVLRQTLKASNADPGDQFGCSLAIDDNGETIAVGACGERSQERDVSTTASDNNRYRNAGAVYVFVDNGEEWIEEAYFKASAPGVRDRFGHSVALNGDGTTLAVGEPFDNTGNVHLFTKSDSMWEYIGGRSAPFRSGQEFGISVALNGSGNRLVVGAPKISSGGIRSGLFYIYNFIGGLLSSGDSISPANQVVNYEFGYAVAVDEVGGRLAVSERHNSMIADTSGAVYIYTAGVGFQDDAKAPNAGEDDLFGNSIAMSKDGRYLAVGALSEDSTATGIYIGDALDNNSFDNDSGDDVGAVYVYEIASNGALTLLSVVKPSIAIDRDGLNYGISVGLGGVGDERSLVIGADGMVEVIPFSQVGPINLSVSTNILTLTRLERSSVVVSVDSAATVSVGAEGMISLEGGETLYELSSDGAVDVFFNGDAVGAGTLTFTARARNGEEETVQVLVTVVLPSFEIQADRPTVYIESGLTATVKVTIPDIPDAVTLRIQSDAPDVATVRDTVIEGLRGSTQLEINGLRAGISTFTLTAEHDDYVTASTQIIVNVLPPIGLSVTPTVFNLYRLSTSSVRVSVNTPAEITVTATDVISLEETEYLLGTAGTVDILLTGIEEGQATITLTAQDPFGRTEMMQVSVTVRESLEVLVNPLQIDLVTGESVNVEVALNRIAPEIGPVTVTLTLTGGSEEISLSTSTLLFMSPLATQVITITGNSFAPDSEIVFDADNEHYVDATVRVKVTFNRLTGDAANFFGHVAVISADGKTLVVAERSGEDGTPDNSGLVHIYTKDTSGLWVLRQTLKASNAGGLDDFGCSVAIDDDGRTVVVGACGEDSSALGVSAVVSNNSLSNSGAAYVFTYDGTEWIEEAYIKASAPGVRARFGHSVALNRDGMILAISEINANDADNGNVYLFTKSGSTWTYRDSVSGVGSGQRFGFSVALNGSGDRLAVGALWAQFGGLERAGAAYIYDFDHSLGLFSNPTNPIEIQSKNQGPGREFGTAVALDEDGDRLAVSERRNNIGRRNGSGAVYTYTAEGNFQFFTKAPNAGNEDLFGGSIAMSRDGRYLAVGARLEDGDNTGIYIGEDLDNNSFDNNLGNNVGAVYVYEIALDGVLTLLSVVKPSVVRDGLSYGRSVGLGGIGDERSLVIGANGMVEIIPFSELRSLGLNVSAETLTVNRLDPSSVRVSVAVAATVSVKAEGPISLVDEETSYGLRGDGTVDVLFRGDPNLIGAATLTFTARRQNGEEETVQVFVTVVLPSFEIQADRPVIYSTPGSTETVEVTITGISEPVTLRIQADAPDVATVTNTVIENLRGSTQLEINSLGAGVSAFTLTAAYPGYAMASTQIIVNVLPPIGLSVTPTVLNLYQLNTSSVRVSVNTPAVITVTTTPSVISLEETEYSLVSAGTVDIPLTGRAEGQATITLTAQDPLGRIEMMQVSVTVLESLEVLVNPPQIDLLTEGSVDIEVALNRIANEIGDVTVSLVLADNYEGISISSPTLLFTQLEPDTQIVTITGYVPYSEIVFDADNENYVDATVRVKGIFNRFIGDVNNRFGESVVISADGQTLVVGERSGEDGALNNTGLAYIYTKDASGLWVLRQTLKASNADEGDSFGCSLAIDDNGGTIAVGACGEDSNSAAASDDNSLPDSGAAYIFVDSGEEWIEEAYIKTSNPRSEDGFGHSAALNGDGTILVVGGPFTDRGDAYLFTKSASTWTHRDGVHGTRIGQEFGSSVALNGSGNRLMIGTSMARFDGMSVGFGMFVGLTYIYDIVGGALSNENFISSENPGVDYEFGHAVALNEGGERLAISEQRNDNIMNDSGAVYIFTAGGDFQSFIKAPNIGEGDLFGNSIAMSRDGRYLAVGARLEDSTATGIHISGGFDNDLGDNVGAVYVYEIASDGTTVLLSVVKPSIVRDDLNYGTSVGLGGIGDERSLVIGADGMVEIIPFSELRSLGLNVSAETLTVNRLDPSSVRVSVAVAATVSVEADGPISLMGGETSYELSADGAVDVLFSGDPNLIGAATLTFTARRQNGEEETVQVFVTVVLPSFEIQTDHSTVDIASGLSEMVKVTIIDNPEAVTLTIQSDVPEVATVTNTVIEDLSGSIDLEITALRAGVSTFTLTAQRSGYAEANTQIIVNVFLSDIGLNVEPQQIRMMERYTQALTLGVVVREAVRTTVDIVVDQAIDTINLRTAGGDMSTETGYVFVGTESTNLTIIGLNAGTARITVTAQAEHYATTNIEIQVMVDEYIKPEIIVSTSELTVVERVSTMVQVSLTVPPVSGSAMIGVGVSSPLLTVSTDTLIFNRENYQVPQMLIITAANNDYLNISDILEEVYLSQTDPTGNADYDYEDTTIRVSVLDDESNEISVTVESISLTEGGPSASLDVSLALPASGTTELEVTFDPVSDRIRLNNPAVPLQFMSTQISIEIEAPDDEVSNDPRVQSGTLRLSGDGYQTRTIPWTVIDDEDGVIQLSANNVTLPEGASTMIDVSINRIDPDALVIVTLRNSTGVTVRSMDNRLIDRLTFTDTGSQSVIVTALHDLDSQIASSETVVFSAVGYEDTTLSATVTNSEEGTIEIVSADEITLIEGASTEIMVRVTVTDTGSLPVTVTVSVTGGLSTDSPEGLLFFNSNEPSTVIVMVVDDKVSTSDRIGTVIFSVTAGGYVPAMLTVNSIEDDGTLTVERPIVNIASGISETVRVTTDISEAVRLTIQSDAPDVATVVDTVIDGVQGSIGLEIFGLREGVSTFTLIAEHPEYIAASTQIIVNVFLSDIGLNVEPQQIRMMERYTQDLTLEVNVRENIRTTVGIVVNQIIDAINIRTAGGDMSTETGYVFVGTESTNLTIIGLNAGTARITVTAQAEHYATTNIEIQVMVDEYIKPEIIVSTSELTVVERVSTMVQVSLTVPPVSGSAMIGVGVSGPLLTVSTDTLIFNRENYQTPQMLTITADDDYLNVGDILAEVYLSQTDPTGNADYDYEDTTIRVNVIDDESNEITVTPESISLTEGDNVTLEISLALLASRTTELNLEFDPVSNRIQLKQSTAVTLQFMPGTPVSIEIEAPDDEVSNDPREQSGTLILSGDGYQTRTIPWTVIDDEDTVGKMLLFKIKVFLEGAQ